MRRGGWPQTYCHMRVTTLPRAARRRRGNSGVALTEAWRSRGSVDNAKRLEHDNHLPWDALASVVLRGQPGQEEEHCQSPVDRLRLADKASDPRLVVLHLLLPLPPLGGERIHLGGLLSELHLAVCRLARVRVARLGLDERGLGRPLDDNLLDRGVLAEAEEHLRGGGGRSRHLPHWRTVRLRNERRTLHDHQPKGEHRFA